MPNYTKFRESFLKEHSNETVYSQIGADYWALETLGKKREGFFVDVGAHDGVSFSNTYLLEKEYDWNGICIEPNSTQYKKLNQSRNCYVSNACVWSENDAVIKFVEPLNAHFGGIKDNMNDVPEARNTVIKKTHTLEFVLDSFGAPAQIDYLNIDTEGSEYTILKNFPFDKYIFRTISVEHNYEEEKQRNLRTLLEKNGYQHVRTILFDDYYINIL